MRYLFVVNPSAGRVDAAALRPRLEREFRGHDISIVSRVPDRRALEAVSPRPTVVAVGGDGTVQRILRDVGAPFPCPLGILPLGTANDLARAAGIPSDLGEACAVVRDSGSRAIDLMEVNGIPFATCGGLGLPASVARRADRLRAGRVVGRGARLFGRFVYLFAALLVLVRRWRPVIGRLEIAGGRPARNYAAIVVSNQPILGGFRPSPDADPGDGELDLCAIEVPRWRPRMLWITLRTLRGDAAFCGEVRTERRRSITIRTERPRTFLGDGEMLGHGTRFEIRVVPGALALVCPDSPFRPSNGRPESGADQAPRVPSPKGGRHEPPKPWTPERAAPRRGRRAGSRDRRRLLGREPARPRR